jgi:hypothetical protein
MRDLTDQYKVTVRTIREVDDAINAIVARVKNHMTWKRTAGTQERPTKAAIVSALILFLDACDEAEQERILTEGLAMLDALLILD